MRIFLGGHLNFYHPRKEKWLEVDLEGPTCLVEVLNNHDIPLGEVHLVVLNNEIVDLTGARISNRDQVKLFSAVGGG
jgi:sulfur carrier protein ThiS